MKIRYIVLFFSSLIVLGCKNFGGVIGNPNKSYGADFNYPSLKTVPYDNPELVQNKSSLRSKVTICTGVADSTGFKCE